LPIETLHKLISVVILSGVYSVDTCCELKMF